MQHIGTGQDVLSRYLKLADKPVTIMVSGTGSRCCLLHPTAAGFCMQAAEEGSKQAAVEAAVQALEKEAAKHGVQNLTAVVALLNWD